jgi:hypothetical protein
MAYDPNTTSDRYLLLFIMTNMHDLLQEKHLTMYNSYIKFMMNWVIIIQLGKVCRDKMKQVIFISKKQNKECQL